MEIFAEHPGSIGEIDPNMAIRRADENNLIFLSANDPALKMEGLYWFNKEKTFRRFPVHPAEPLPEGVEYLAWHTAGAKLRFTTDSSRLVIKAQLREKGLMNHMPQTGSAGFDLYVENDHGEYEFHYVSCYNTGDTEFTCNLFRDRGVKKNRNFILHFPLYNGVNHFEIGFDSDANIQLPPSYADTRPVVIYGTSITQGGCASRPGMCYTNILQRKLGIEVLNFGFSGSGRGETVVARELAKIANPALYVLDFEANCHIPGGLEQNLSPFIDALRAKHPSTPILVVSKVKYSSYYTEDERLDARRKIQYDEVIRRRNSGDCNIYFLDGSTLTGDDYWECSVDGVHANDLGFSRMAAGMLPVIQTILP